MRLLLLSFLLILSTAGRSKAQIIPNQDFEIWDTVDYEDINSTFWITANRFWIPNYKLAVADKVVGYSSPNAIRLEVKTVGGDTLTPIIANELDGLFDGEGGKPYNEGQPTAFKGYYRHNLLNNDSAQLVMVTKKNGLILSADTIWFTGSQSTFTEFNRPLNLIDKPDTIITYAVVGNIVEEIPGTPGSWLELDSLNFVIGGIPRLLPDGNFENWVRYNYDLPFDWRVPEDVFPGSVVRTTDKYSGTYALQLSTVVDSFNMDTIQAEIVSNNITIGGPIVDQSDSVVFYYKYATQDTDMATVVIQYYDNSGNTVGTMNFVFLSATPNFTKVEVPINNRPNNTSYMRISLYSSSFLTGEKPGSVFIIDDMKIINFLGVNDVPAFSYRLFPNPAQDILNISTKDVCDYAVKDLAGKTLRNGNTSTGRIDIADLPSGTYLLVLSSKDGTQQTAKFSKQ